MLRRRGGVPHLQAPWFMADLPRLAWERHSVTEDFGISRSAWGRAGVSDAAAPQAARFTHHRRGPWSVIAGESLWLQSS